MQVRYSLYSIENFIDYNVTMWDRNELRWVSAFLWLKTERSLCHSNERH